MASTPIPSMDPWCGTDGHDHSTDAPAGVHYVDERATPAGDGEALLVESLLNLPQARLARRRVARGTWVASGTTGVEWRQALPVLRGARATLRELTTADAGSLMGLLSNDRVSRFISPPPSTREGFEQFIAWAHRKRQAGTHISFGVVPEGRSAAVGLFQLRRIASRADVAEWGFAIGEPYWGTGLFTDAAAEVIAFALHGLGIRRLVGRASAENSRGNAALRKLGAVRERALRPSFLENGRHHDEALWALSTRASRHTAHAVPTLHASAALLPSR
jgi:ribosomal-protein-alanine N-acetyltransferase